MPRELDHTGGTIPEAMWLDLGRMPYTPSFAIQERAIKARIKGELGTSIILQENNPIFTIGRSGSRANILIPEALLKERGIEVREVNRGGDVTYHGPGQLIVSPLLFLGDIQMNANEYMHHLEDLVMRMLSEYGIPTYKKEDYPGVWHEEGKIAAVGIAVKHGFTFHGFALNVDPDLDAFNLINPCGVLAMPVTSMGRVLGRAPGMDEIKTRLKETLAQDLGLRMREVSVSEFEKSLPPEIPRPDVGKAQGNHSRAPETEYQR